LTIFPKCKHTAIFRLLSQTRKPIRVKYLGSDVDEENEDNEDEDVVNETDRSDEDVDDFE